MGSCICFRCKTDFPLPDELYAAARKSPDISFWCPYGHKQHFPSGPSEAEQLRQERDRLKQREAWYEERLRNERERTERERRTAIALKGQNTKLRNRAANGVCPCCSRHFGNLQRHIATKHPEFKADNVVDFKAESA